jgi:hypothetical protein
MKHLREHIKVQFTNTLQEEQLKKKVSFLLNRMQNAYADLKLKLCKSIDMEQIIESECKMVEEMKTTQKKNHKDLIKMVFSSIPSFLKDTLTKIQQKCSSRGVSAEQNKLALIYLPDIFSNLFKYVDRFVLKNIQKYRMYNMV